MRFARQLSYGPPPEFPLASPCSGIVHHLSGPNRYAPTQCPHLRRIELGRWCQTPTKGIFPTDHFHFAYGFTTQRLAYMSDSLVRVSRRVNHFPLVNIPNPVDTKSLSTTTDSPRAVTQSPKTHRRVLDQRQERAGCSCRFFYRFPFFDTWVVTTKRSLDLRSRQYTQAITLAPKH